MCKKLTSDYDFEKYEKDYVKRIKAIDPELESKSERDARLRREAAVRSASESPLDSWDMPYLR